MTQIFAMLVKMYDAKFTDSCEKSRIETIMTNRYNQPIYVVSNWINENGDPEIAYRGYNLANAQSELSDATRVSGFEDTDQIWHLHAEFDGDSEVIDSKAIPAINAATDELLQDVQVHFGGKYTDHVTGAGSFIKLRIADHSGKHKNNDCYTISVVIANINKTEHFYKQSADGIGGEVFFDDTYTAEEIIEAINCMLADADVIA